MRSKLIYVYKGADETAYLSLRFFNKQNQYKRALENFAPVRQICFSYTVELICTICNILGHKKVLFLCGNVAYFVTTVDASVSPYEAAAAAAGAPTCSSKARSATRPASPPLSVRSERHSPATTHA